MNPSSSPRCEQSGSNADATLLDLYLQLRRHTETLVAPLNPEDMAVQSMPDASPVKWHLAHTTWFFETFLLSAILPAYCQFDPSFGYLFNSYYEALGPRQPRPQRGLLTRPTVSKVLAYRRHVDTHMRTLLKSALSAETEALLRLGLAHEEQHQELLLMDLLHLFSQSPLRPAYDPRWPADEPGRSDQPVRSGDHPGQLRRDLRRDVLHDSTYQSEHDHLRGA